MFQTCGQQHGQDHGQDGPQVVSAGGPGESDVGGHIVKINPQNSPESDSCIHNILQYTNISFYYILKLPFIIQHWDQGCSGLAGVASGKFVI